MISDIEIRCIAGGQLFCAQMQGAVWWWESLSRIGGSGAGLCGVRVWLGRTAVQAVRAKRYERMTSTL
jgi:hypothetical protein